MINNSIFEAPSAWNFSSKYLNRDLHCHHLPNFKKVENWRLKPGEIFEVISDEPSLNTLHVLHFVVSAILPTSIHSQQNMSFNVELKSPSKFQNTKKNFQDPMISIPIGEEITVKTSDMDEESSHCVLIYDFEGKYDKELIKHMIYTLLLEAIKKHCEVKYEKTINPTIDDVAAILGYDNLYSILSCIHIVQPLTFKAFYVHLNYINIDPDMPHDHMDDDQVLRVPYSIIVLDNVMEIFEDKNLFMKSLKELLELIDKNSISLVASSTIQASKDLRNLSKSDFQSHPDLAIKMYGNFDDILPQFWKARVKFKLCFKRLSPFKYFAVVKYLELDQCTSMQEFEVRCLTLLYQHKN
mmetsp:Transcript_2055/g.2966  ORF Transcript_2055/g.2966 Transcript_2055/m.2966 type:complete len:354 (+) Transcript_2055:50-1111(+)